jgi:hypothetical protein
VFIIWGFRSFVRELGRVFITCGSCNTPASHRISEIRRKFTLFFVPLFTVRKRHVLTCAMCGHASRITEEQATKVLTPVGAAPGSLVSPAQSAASAPVDEPAHVPGCTLQQYGQLDPVCPRCRTLA